MQLGSMLQGEGVKGNGNPDVDVAASIGIHRHFLTLFNKTSQNHY